MNTERLTFAFVLATGVLLAAAGMFNVGWSPPVALQRELLLAFLAIVGFLAARDVGFSIEPKSWRSPVAGVLVAAAVGAVIVPLDRAFGMPPPLADTEPLVRLIILAGLAFNEEVVFRLFLVSALVWAFARIGRADRGSLTIITAIVIAQAVNAFVHLPPPTDGVSALYFGARYIVPGVAWGWLYWRHGFVTAQLGHIGCHAMMAPFV